MFERFADDAREAVKLAKEEARRLRHRRIGTEHLLLGLLGRPETLSAGILTGHRLDRRRALEAITRLAAPADDDLDADALQAIGIDLGKVREKVEAVFGLGALDRPPGRTDRGRLVSGRHVPFTPRAKKVLELSLREAIALKSGRIRDGHILLGIIREGEGTAARIMTEAGIELPSLRAEVRARLARSA